MNSNTDQNSNKTDINTLILGVIDNIPTHHDEAKSIEEIAVSLANNFTLPLESAYLLSSSVLAFLNLFGILRWKNGAVKVKCQIPLYFLKCIRWYLNHKLPIFTNWETEGTSREIKITNLLNRAPHFLKILEHRRVTLAQEKGIELDYSRHQAVSILLIKGTHVNNSYFLYQLDTKAGRYQLIGGKIRPSENHFETAKRELFEELLLDDLSYGKDYELQLLNRQEKPLTYQKISRTYGALTYYEVWFYWVKFRQNQLLDDLDENINIWVSMDEIKKGISHTGKLLHDPEIYELIEKNIPGSLEGLHNSIEKIQVWGKNVSNNQKIDKRQLSVTLQKEITDFLISLPNIHDSNSQRALISQACLDSQLQDSIPFGKPPSEFIHLLVPLLIKYGKLNDDRDALKAVLEVAKDYVGKDQRAHRETIIQQLDKL